MDSKQFTFYKNANKEWYMDLPNWKGDPEDLQMIKGADAWLDLICNRQDKVLISFAAEPFENAETLTLLHVPEENLGGGGVYYLETYQQQKADLKLWLCDVTCFVFDELPQKIYFKVL